MLSDEEIEHFQDLIDVFVEVWIDLFADKGIISNYVHLLASGHIQYFLKKYRCLYIYSQQSAPDTFYRTAQEVDMGQVTMVVNHISIH